MVIEPALSPAEFSDMPETPADFDESEEDISEGKTVYIEDMSKPTKSSTDMDEVTLTEVIETSDSLDSEEDEKGGIFGNGLYPVFRPYLGMHSLSGLVWYGSRLYLVLPGDQGHRSNQSRGIHKRCAHKRNHSGLYHTR